MFGSAANKTIDGYCYLIHQSRNNKWRIWNPTKCSVRALADKNFNSISKVVHGRSRNSESRECSSVGGETVYLIASRNCKDFNLNVLRGDSCDFNFCDGSNYALLDKTADSSCSNSFPDEFYFFASPAPQKKVIGHFVFS